GNNFQNNQGYRAQMNNAPNFQNQGFQNQSFSVPNNQIPPSVPNEFSRYIKSNKIMIKSIQNQINVLRGDFNKQEENLRKKLNNDMRSILGSFFQNQPSTLGTLSSNNVPNPKGEMKAVTTHSGLAYDGPSIPTNSPLEKVDEQNTEEILDKKHSNSSGSTAQVQPPVVPISLLKPDVPRTQPKPTIPYPSRLNDQKLREKATNQMEKLFQIFHDLHFDISFADALLLMLKFASTIKSLLENKDKVFELAKVPLNENCSTMLLKNLPEKLGDPGKFLIPCDFPGMNVFHALSDLEASINLMPLSIWKKLSLPELTPTQMTLELADRSITPDPRVPLILGRSFLRTGRALIDVYEEEITLKVNHESVTFNLNQVMRYSDNSMSRVNVINIACGEFVQDNTKSSSPTLVFDASISENESCKEPIDKSSSPTLTPFGENELDKVTESSTKNLVPIPSEYEVTSDNESEYNEPIKDDSSSAFTAFTNPLFNDKDDFTSNDNKSIHDEDVPIEESKVYSNPLFDDDEINSDEIDLHSLMPIYIANEERIRIEHAKYISLIERLITINPCPHPMENSNTIVESLPSSLIPDQDNDSQREEIDIVTDTDELLPTGFENDDSEGEIYVLEELLVDNSIPSSENELSNFDHDNSLFPRPPPEPSDVEFDFEPNSREEISAVMNNNDKLECFDLGDEIDIFTNVEDDDYFPFMFVIRIFLPCLIYPEVFPLLLSTGSEDTIFDPVISN
nr:reverse transcriptase domain-containing protein [Tanacetum cinerariifolium]